MPLHDGVRLRGRLAVRIRSNDDQKKVLQTANATETSIGSIASDKETAECDVKDAYASRMALPPPVLAAFNTHKTVGLPSPSTTHTKPQFGMSNKFGIGHNNSKHAHSIDSDTQSNEDEIDIDSFVDDVKDALCRDVVAEFNFQNKHIIPSLTFGTNHVDIDIKDEDIANDDTFTFQGRVTNHQHSLISIDEYETMPRGNEGDCNDQALERLCSDGIRQLDASLDVRCFIEWKRKNNIGVSGFSRDCTQKKKFARKVKKELQWAMPQAQRLYDFVSKRICWGGDRKTTDNADTFVMNPKAPTFVLSNDDKVAIVTSHPHNDATIPTILSNDTIMSNPNTISVDDPDSNSHNSRSRSPFPTQSQCDHKTEKEEPSNGGVIHCEPFKPSKRKQPGLRTNVFVSKESTRDLAEHIVDEDWGTNNDKLYKYLDYIFRCQIFEDQVKKITFSNKEEIVLFHTGLQRRRDLEFVYFALKPNDADKRDVAQQWRVPAGPMDEVCFSKDELMGSPFNLQRKHVPQRTMFDELFDESYPIEVNLVEQLRIHKDRIYKELKQKTGLKEPFDCALKEAKKRVKANPRLVVAQGFVDSKHYKKRVEFLLPLKVKYSKESNQFHTFALALRKEENVKKYTGVSLLTTSMAYANARLVGYVNSSWLTSDNGGTHNRKNEMDEKKQDKDRSPSYHHPDTVNITGDNLPDTPTKPPDLPHTSNDPIVCKIHKVENRNGQMNDTQRPMGVKKPWSGKEVFVFGGPSSSALEIAKRNDAVLFHAGCDRTTAQITAFKKAVQKLDKGSTILVHGYSNIKMYEPFVNCAVRNGCAKVRMMGRMRYPPWMDTSSNIWKCDSKVEVIYESV